MQSILNYFCYSAMKHLTISLILIHLILLPSILLAHNEGHEAKNVLFVENKGQWGDKPFYRSEFHGGYGYFEPGQITYVVKDMEAMGDLLGFKMKPDEYKQENKPNFNIPHHAYRLIFEGANQNARVIPEGKTPDYNNYYLGNNEAKWASHVRKYTQITYQELYPGINLRFNQVDHFMKYTFEVDAGVHPGRIAMTYNHIERLRLKNERLIIKTSVHDVVEAEPYAYQIIEGDTVDIPCRFTLDDHTVGYEFPGGYNQNYPLFIDPTLVFSTYSGSTSDNWGYTATYDSDGYAYGGGTSFGSGYPTTMGSYDVDYSGGGCDMVITKYDTTGSNLIYSTYLGGSGVDVPHSLVCNSYDHLIVLGTTGSSDFPTTTNAFDTTFNGGTQYTLTSIINYANGSDITLSKFTEDGTQLMSSTYVGGSGNDGLNSAPDLKYNYADEVRGEVMVDDYDAIFVASSTYSSDFPMKGNGFQKTIGGGQDGIIFKMSSMMDGLYWSSFMGGSGDDALYNISVSLQSSLYVAGGTNSQNLPVSKGAYQSSFQGGSADGFVSYINNAGDQLLACTYFGSSAYDQVYFVDEDLDHGVYVLGQTGASGNTYVYNAPWNQPGGGQFVSQISKYLKTVTFSTAFGNASNPGPDISPTSFMVDFCGGLYIAGWGGGLNNFGGTSGLPVTADAYQKTTDNNDYYFMVLEKDAQDLHYATFFGGNQNVGEHVDGGTSRFSKKGAIYQAICSGCGGYSDMPTTPNAWSSTNNSSNCNLAVVKFKFDVKAVIADFKRPESGCVPYHLQLENRSFSSGTDTHYYWDFGDGDTSMAYEPAHTYTEQGVYQITLVVVDSTTCNISDSAAYNILVLGDTTYSLPAVSACKGDSVYIGIPSYNNPSVIYNWSPTTYLPGITYMPVNNISKPNTMILPRTDTNFILTIDNQVCVDSVIQPVEVIDLLADAGPDQLLCDSVVTFNGSGAGSDTLYYFWSSSGSFSDTLNADTTVPDLTHIVNNSQDFYFKVTDGKCEAVDTVNVDFLIDVVDSTATPTCHGDCDGRIKVTAVGGNGPYSYQWDNGMSGPVIDNLCGGTYTVTVYDSDSCLAVKTISIPDPAPLNNSFAVFNAPCEEVCIGEAASSPSGGTAPYNFIWSDGQTSDTASQLCVGQYYLTITDDHGCKYQDTVDVNDASVNFDFTAHAEKDTIYQGQSTRLYTQDTLNYFYSWTPAESLETPNSASTKASPEQTTTYILTVSDQYGCTFTDTITIFVKEVSCGPPYIFVPNAFTPNGDGNNDVLYVRTQFADEVYFAVYHRWGEKVFETTNKDIGWDGKINGKQADAGVYVYRLRVRCFTKEVYEESGNVTLIR